MSSFCGTSVIRIVPGEVTVPTVWVQALMLSPGNPKVLNNVALGIALAGRLVEAICLLRLAVQHPQATVQVRQNLSLLLAMKGDVEEAGRLARADLPTAISDNNIAFFKSLNESSAP